MAGKLISLLPFTRFDMSGLTTGSTAVVTVASRIDVSSFDIAEILVRIHGGTTWSGGAAVLAGLAPDAWTREDPAALWSVNIASNLTFTEGVDALPIAKVLAYSTSTPTGPLAWAVLGFVQGSAVATFTPCVSIDLSLKGQ